MLLALYGIGAGRIPSPRPCTTLSGRIFLQERRRGRTK